MAIMQDGMGQMASPRSFRILVVDDHQDTAEVTARLLRLEGHSAAYATSAPDARKMAATGCYDLLISDIGLPGERGLELLRSLKETYAITGIAISGSDDRNGDADAKEAGYAARMLKPITMEKLLQVISDVTVDLP